MEQFKAIFDDPVGILMSETAMDIGIILMVIAGLIIITALPIAAGCIVSRLGYSSSRAIAIAVVTLLYFLKVPFFDMFIWALVIDTAATRSPRETELKKLRIKVTKLEELKGSGGN